MTRPQDKARAHQAGFDLHMPKPVHPQALSEAAARIAIADNGPGPGPLNGRSGRCGST